MEGDFFYYYNNIELTKADTPQELLDLINDPTFEMFDQWQVQKQAVIQVWADIYVYSQLTNEQVKAAMLNPTSNIEATMEGLKEKYGKEMTVAVLPLGPFLY